MNVRLHDYQGQHVLTVHLNADTPPDVVESEDRVFVLHPDGYYREALVAYVPAGTQDTTPDWIGSPAIPPAPPRPALAG